ncbi:fimbria/pilus periplasmic chaperone [Salmonella enterica]|nr:fimbria/pilus periplasmic chaperone [Salmonella enterica]EGM3390169.1 fimbria/pilus periplasmic chaperone [Salmonella enterica]EHE3387878.1 fimbria/pilus periplasmic chaperone [Salmonella enterica]
MSNKNNTCNYTILVQPHAFAEDMKSNPSFVVTPPLFRLNAKQQHRLRIIRVGGDFANDCESI